MERGSTCRLNPTWYLVSQHFGLRERQENYNSRNDHFKFAFAKNENGCTYVTFVDSNSKKMRISPIKLQGRMVIQRMVASSGEKMCPADVFEEFVSRRPSKRNESPWFEKIVNKLR